MELEKLAAGYARCSTDMQDESVAQQRKAIETWAVKNGYTVRRWFEDEGKSGTSFENRPGFKAMVRAVEQKSDFAYLLVYDESRWGRAGNPRESTYWKMHLERHGVKVRVINSQSKNENDIGSFVVEVVESAEASEYSKKLSRSTKRGCVARNRAGRSSGGTAPYGYERVAVAPGTAEAIRDLPEGVHRRKGEEEVSLKPGNRHEVAVVQRMFEMKARGIGCKTIATTLNDEQVSCPRRGRWRSKDQKWSAGSVRAIITNRVYSGARVYNRQPKNKLQGGRRGPRNPESEWIVTENAHPGLVSKALWEQANMSKGYKYAGGASRAIAGPYLLSGLITCRHCGFHYVGYSRDKKGLRYYADSGYINKGKSVCSWHVFRKDDLEGFVLRLIHERLLGGQVVERLRDLIQAYLDERGRSTGSEEQGLEREIQENAKKMNNLLALVEQGIQRETVLPRIRELEAERVRLVAEGEKVRRMLVDRKVVHDATEEACQFMLHLPTKLQTVPIIEQRALLKQIVDGIDVDRANDELVVRLRRIPKTNNPALSAILRASQPGVHSNVCPEQDLNLHDSAVRCI